MPAIFTHILPNGRAAFSHTAYEVQPGDWCGPIDSTLTQAQVRSTAAGLNTAVDSLRPSILAWLEQLNRAVAAYDAKARENK